MLAPEYVRSPIGVAKFIVLVASAATLILSGSTRPTDLQKELVMSTWKEDGLFYLSITGIVMTLCSVAVGIIFSNQCSRRDMRIKEMIIFGAASSAFLIFGPATLESALSIFGRVGDCCQDMHGESNNTCTLPGIVEEYYAYIKYPGVAEAVTPMTINIGGAIEVTFPDLPECDPDLDFTSRLCTVCVNELIQPMFEMKGAAGAAGLIAALAYFIVVFVGVREIRARKPTLASTFRYN